MFSETKIKVRYQETDQMGIVHHSVYPIWYEEARTNFIKEIGMSYTDVERMGILLPLIKLSCKYIKPALYEDIITIHTKIKLISPVKIEFEYELYKNNIIINTGYTEHAFINKNFNLINLKKQNIDLYNKIISAYKN